MNRMPLMLMLALVLLPASATAQRNPRIGYVYPAGGQCGSVMQLKLAGQFLDGASGVVVSGGGVEASVIEHTKPLSGKQLNLVRDRVKALQQALAAAAREDTTVELHSEAETNRVEVLERRKAQQELAELRQKLANPKNRARENLQLSEDVLLAVRIDADAAPGRRELRLRTAAGLSNPLVFQIGPLPEYAEKEPNNTCTNAPLVSLFPVIINGQIMPGDVDCFRLRVTKGTKLVATAAARELIPYLADAVPGWFQATLALYDAKGAEVAYNDDYHLQPDPVLTYEIPHDGEYVLEVKDAIYRGREDFVYRIRVGELPFLTSIFPLGGPVGETCRVELQGWNLPTNSQTLNPPAGESGVMLLEAAGAKYTSNPQPFAISTLPECREQESGDQTATSQTVTLPIVINGRIYQPGEHDVYRFTGHAGDLVVAEVYARRLNSPLDATLTLLDAEGKPIAFNDDFECKASGLNTHHADSRLMVTLPADGAYQVQIADAQQKGGTEFAYRLRLSPPQPDFELRATPASLNARAGGGTTLTVFAFRQDGFTNDIAIALGDAPPGFKLSPGRITGTNEQVKLTLTVPNRVLGEPARITIQGRATLQNRKLMHSAIPAEDMMQAFAYRHLVPVQELLVAVSDRARTRPQTEESGSNPPSRKTTP